MTTTDLGPRPYSRLRTQPPSVTTILGELSKDGLSWGSAKETALYAVHHQDEWTSLDPAAAVDKLRKHHRGVWDNRAAIGSITHSVMEEWIHGRAVDISKLTEDPQQVNEVMRNCDGLEKFLNDFTLTEVTSEEIVRQPGEWIGTRDVLCTINGQRWLLDLKSTGNQEAGKGLYVDSWATQLAAYRYALQVVTFKRDDKGKIVEDKVTLNESVDRCGVIHLRGDGEYQLLEIDAGPEALDIFHSLRQVHLWRKSLPTPKPVIA